MIEGSIYSPREACDIAGCKRGYITSLERSQILVPHRGDRPSENTKPKPLLYYDREQIKMLKAAVKLRYFIAPKYLRRLLKQDRFLSICDQLIETLEAVDGPDGAKVLIEEFKSYQGNELLPC